MHKTLQILLVFFGVALYHQALLARQRGTGLVIDATNADAPAIETENFVEKSVIWIQDEADEECLGPHGFGSCGDANLWRVWYEGGSTLRFEHINSVDTHEPPRGLSQSLCLARYFSWMGDSKIGLSRCMSLPFVASSKWGVTTDGYLVNTHLGTEYCLFRLGGAVRADDCRRRYGGRPVLRPVLHSLPPGESVSIRAISQGPPSGRRCPSTGLHFPEALFMDNANMRAGYTAQVVHTGPTPPAAHWDELSLFALGTYHKVYFGMSINVYSVAFYVPKSWRSVDPIASKYRGKNVTSGEYALPFVQDLLEDVVYDRAVFIQLAMTLSKSTLVQGLVDDLPMKDENKALVMEAANKYSNQNCERGLTLTVIWRGTAHALCPGCLDVAIDGVLLDSINSAGLGQDFFTQFVSDDPVSEHAKLALLNQYSHSFME